TPSAAVLDLTAGARESLDDALLIGERQLTLADELRLDVAEPGQYDGNVPPSGGSLAPGTEVASVLVHFDPPPLDGGAAVLVVSGTLPGPLLGALATEDGLVESDG